MRQAMTAGVRALCCLAALTLLLPSSAGAEKLSPFLEKLVGERDRMGSASAERMARARGMRPHRRGSKVWVQVILEPAEGRGRSIDPDRIRRLGGEVDAVSQSFVSARIPVRKLRRLAEHPGIRVIRAPTPLLALESGLGVVVSESVAATGAQLLQGLGVNGSGVKVAVVDLGFIGLASAISAGELPANTIAVDLPGGNDNPIEADTQHGVGVAEHVADMAPGIELHCIKVSNEVDLENAADYIRDQGIAIANHSVAWAIASYYDDTGPINGIVNRSRDQDGVFWTVAAGNAARRHWRGTWADADLDNWLDFVPGDDLMALTNSNSQACIFLNWNQYGNSVTDLDLYILDQSGTFVAGSNDFQNGPQDPSEGSCFSYDAALAPYSVIVEWYTPSTAPPPGLDITLFSFFHNFEYPIAASSLMDPAPAHGAFTVAAVPVGSFDDANPQPEGFSSQGPTNDGRSKPDLAAPDGTSSTTYGILGSFGTSFAAPTVAGAAALLISQDPSRSAGDIASLLRGQAIDAGGTGEDPLFGAGLLSLGTACEDGDGDAICDADDNCPTRSNADQQDVDGDQVGDACDNCVETYNPQLGTLDEPALASFQTSTGGQLDDNGDGFGNACDGKSSTGGQVVGGVDLIEITASFNKSREGTNCGVSGTLPCAWFDLDNRADVISGSDLTLLQGRFNRAPGPKCPTCPLACVGARCPQ